MLIRTQDKLTLVNLDQVKEIRILKDRELAEVTNVLNNYKSMLFGGI